MSSTQIDLVNSNGQRACHLCITIFSPGYWQLLSDRWNEMFLVQLFVESYSFEKRTYCIWHCIPYLFKEKKKKAQIGPNLGWHEK